MNAIVTTALVFVAGALRIVSSACPGRTRTVRRSRLWCLGGPERVCTHCGRCGCHPALARFVGAKHVLVSDTAFVRV